jgi:hypothetical protein
MLPNIPAYITEIFIATVVLTWWLVLMATKNKMVGFVSIAWLLLTGILAYNGFYLDTNGLPPKFIFAVAPVLLAILLIFANPKGRRFIDGLDLRLLTLISIVRIPVELVLYWLSQHKAIPELLTFTGRNFDILAGISALVVYYACFKGNKVTNRSALLVWNIISLGLLLNIVINAVLSAPFRFQQFGFDQPNIAVLYFPFSWLPSFIVMTVLFSHLVSIRKLAMTKNKQDILHKI